MGDVKIFVLDRGWVIVAEVAGRSSCGMTWLLGWTAVVRRWGTTGGLGELAVHGPQTKTILDTEPSGGEINHHSIMRVIPCGDAWKGWIEKQTH